MEELKPIIYSDTLKVRFSDLDPYGHENSAFYLDYVISSRWNFLEKSLDVSSQDLIEKGLGFYLIKSEINYKRAIKGATEVSIESFVSEVKRTRLYISFSMSNADRKVCSDGVLEFAIMNLKSGMPQGFPEWATYLFWET